MRTNRTTTARTGKPAAKPSAKGSIKGSVKGSIKGSVKASAKAAAKRPTNERRNAKNPNSAPPEGGRIPEIRENVDQKEIERFAEVAARLSAEAGRFVRQGAVVASWRYYQGKRLGPYYRLAYREDGRQRSIYLGASEWLAEAVRQFLARLQAPLRERRGLARLKAEVRASLRRHQAELRRFLAGLGVVVKGFEFRGLVGLLRRIDRWREESTRDARAAAAWRVITGAAAPG